jgi:hypothetical protein
MGKNPYDQRICLVVGFVARGQQTIRLAIKRLYKVTGE